MNFLITGGAGFIGSHLAEVFISRGDKVTVIDDLSTGNRQNISEILKDKNFSFVEGTILDEKLMSELIERSDVVCHLAASVGVKFVIDNPVKSIEINVKGTEIVVKLASKFKRKVFLSSTSEVYGKTENGLFREDSDRVVGATTIRRWSYSCSKALDEFLCLAYHAERGLPVVIGRIFNTCGPRQIGKYGMVIPRFVKQALSNEPLTVYGDGKQTRSFCYVDDLVEGIIKMMNSREDFVGPVNLGNPNEFTILELAKKIIKLTNSKSQLVFKELPEDDPKKRKPDISLAEKELNWRPSISLKEGLTYTIEYFDKLLEKV